MKTIISVHLLLFSLTSQSLAQAVLQPGYFAALQQAYREQVKTIDEQHAERVKNASAEYTNALNALEQTLAKKGNLDGVLAVKNEKERFKILQEISHNAVVESPPELKDLQLKFMRWPATLETRRKDETAKASSDYVGKLEKLKAELTKNMKIDEALAVKTEIENVKSGVAIPPAVQTRERGIGRWRVWKANGRPNEGAPYAEFYKDGRLVFPASQNRDNRDWTYNFLNADGTKIMTTRKDGSASAFLDYDRATDRLIHEDGYYFTRETSAPPPAPRLSNPQKLK